MAKKKVETPEEIAEEAPPASAEDALAQLTAEQEASQAAYAEAEAAEHDRIVNGES